MKIKSMYILVSSLCLSFVATVKVYAQGINDPKPLEDVVKKTGLQNSSNIGTLAGSFINAALSLVGIIFLVLMVYAGVLWMTARGADEQIEKSKKIIYASIIGLFITVSAYAITIFVTKRF
ncbi:MAG TPA: hypothetical protein DCS29_01995 [Candidatus Magasanikbacteria bacterium]|nr:hypothetical protein [Candidatus Magasanikbacteria bacterium]